MKLKKEPYLQFPRKKSEKVYKGDWASKETKFSWRNDILQNTVLLKNIFNVLLVCYSSSLLTKIDG